MSSKDISGSILPLPAPNLSRLLDTVSPDTSGKLSLMETVPLHNGNLQQTILRWLSPEERAVLDCYTFEKRKSEWLSGRICAKKAVLALLKDTGTVLPQETEFSISANNTGRPFVVFSRDSSTFSSCEISISHSHGLAAGMASENYCGIDIQLLDNTLFKVRDRFCTDIESAVLEEIPADEIAHLGLLWAGKEAVRKSLSAHQLIGFRELKLVGARELENGFILDFLPQISGIMVTDSDIITAAAILNDSFVMAACIIPQDMLHA